MSFSKIKWKSKKGAIVTPMTCSTVQPSVSRIGGKRGYHWSFSCPSTGFHILKNFRMLPESSYLIYSTWRMLTSSLNQVSNLGDEADFHVSGYIS